MSSGNGTWTLKKSRNVHEPNAEKPHTSAEFMQYGTIGVLSSRKRRVGTFGGNSNRVCACSYTTSSGQEARTVHAFDP